MDSLKFCLFNKYARFGYGIVENYDKNYALNFKRRGGYET